MPKGETVTNVRKYHDHVIKTVTQDSGRKTYDIYSPNGDIMEFAVERLNVARAIIDA